LKFACSRFREGRDADRGISFDGPFAEDSRDALLKCGVTARP
jgi:hypothetical protein